MGTITVKEIEDVLETLRDNELYLEAKTIQDYLLPNEDIKKAWNELMDLIPKSQQNQKRVLEIIDVIRPYILKGTK